MFVLGVNLVTNGSIGFSFSQTAQLNNIRIDTKVQTNSLNLSKPIYQVTNDSFFCYSEYFFKTIFHYKRI